MIIPVLPQALSFRFFYTYYLIILLTVALYLPLIPLIHKILERDMLKFL